MALRPMRRKLLALLTSPLLVVIGCYVLLLQVSKKAQVVWLLQTVQQKLNCPINFYFDCHLVLM